MLFRQIVDERLAQYTYLVGCQRTGEALLIDPERDVDRYLALAEEEGLTITAATETHIHADFLSGARELARRGVKVYLSGQGGRDWSYRWPELDDVPVTLLRDGDVFAVGNIEIRAVHTPGHTPEHISFLVTDRGGGADEPMGIVSGDFVFVGDTGRPDLLESAAGVQGAMREGAHTLYHSVRRFLDLPDWLQLWPGHGAGSACGKALGAVPESTVGYERRFSPALGAAREGEEAFVRYVLEGQPEPPLYFGRMKTLNRDGPPLLSSLPRPARLTVAELGNLAGRADLVVIDMREDRSAFMRGHLPGSLHAPLGKDYPTVAGSYVEPELPIHLLVEEEQLDDAIRALVRIGLDRIEGWAPPETLAAWAATGGSLSAIEEIDILEVADRMGHEDTAVLDVRRLSEYQEGHVPGALQVAHTRLAARLGDLPAGKTLLVHCRTGNRSAAAAAFLARAGYPAVYVNGSIDRWFAVHAGEQGGLAGPGAAGSREDREIGSGREEGAVA